MMSATMQNDVKQAKLVAKKAEKNAELAKARAALAEAKSIHADAKDDAAKAAAQKAIDAAEAQLNTVANEAIELEKEEDHDEAVRRVINGGVRYEKGGVLKRLWNYVV